MKKKTDRRRTRNSDYRDVSRRPRSVNGSADNAQRPSGRRSRSSQRIFHLSYDVCVCVWVCSCSYLCVRVCVHRYIRRQPIKSIRTILSECARLYHYALRVYARSTRVQYVIIAGTDASATGKTTTQTAELREEE